MTGCVVIRKEDPRDFQSTYVDCSGSISRTSIEDTGCLCGCNIQIKRQRTRIKNPIDLYRVPLNDYPTFLDAYFNSAL